MSTPDNQWWARARLARDKLAAQVLHHPNVSLVDIGEDPTGKSPMPVLRVHIRQANMPAPTIPDVIDNIPVHVVHGNYRLQ